ncbi:MAG: hypothetical protein ACLGI2_14420 [Acidimicrobiia bacterium]
MTRSSPSPAWWDSGEGRDDPPPSHVVEFRPVLRVRLAVAPDADAEAVARAAAEYWAAALHGYDSEGRRWEAEFWGAGAGDDALVLGVEVVASDHSIEDIG